MTRVAVQKSVKIAYTAPADGSRRAWSASPFARHAPPRGSLRRGDRQDEEDASSEGNLTMGDTTENQPAATVGAEAPFRPHTSHWGVFSARMRDGELEVRPHPGDPDPNEIIQNFPAALRHRARIAQPMVRRGWLENGPGPDDRRGRDDYVPMSWDAVLDLLAKELL